MAHGRSTTAADGAAIRRHRERRGMNLRQLAEACRKAGRSISDSQLSKIEREVCRPRPAVLVALAKVYSVELDALIKADAA